MNKLHPIIIELLRQRGITDEADIAEFLSEKPQKTYSPFLLADMEAGVDLILSKISEGEKICIYGDYDADGITAIALLWKVLSNMTSNLEYYIPSRFDEGYGLNKDAIAAIKEGGAGLVVTVDCGSVSYDEVEFAKSIGMDIVVTDHHSITNTVADCILINPKRNDCTYPCKHLAGVGVAFKLAQALQQKAGLPKSVINGVLDLVAVGTIGDIVPLVDENRTLVKYGLRLLNERKHKGIKKLLEGANFKSETITADNVAFIIVPHINAAGRMLDARIAAELLISDDEAALDRCVAELISNNKNRKTVQENTYKACAAEVDASANNDKFILINSDEIHEGIAGIVAGKLKEKYEKPAIIVTPSGEDGGYLKGTGRSIENINLYELLKNCEDLYEKFGGHAGACGFLIKKEYIDEFKERIDNKIGEMLALNADLLSDKKHEDLELITEQASIELAGMLEMLAPFGNKNPKPLFRIPAQNAFSYSTMGTEGQHIRFAIRNPRGPNLSCVMFNGSEQCLEIFEADGMFDVVGNIEKQVWNGSDRLQFMVSYIEQI